MKIPPHLFLLLNIIGFGLWGFIGKIGTSAMGKYRYLLVSYLTVTVLTGVLLWSSNEPSPGFSPVYLYPVVSGIFTWMAVTTYFYALEEMPLSTVASLSSLYPVITITLSIVFLQERPTVSQGLGMILALIAGFLIGR